MQITCPVHIGHLNVYPRHRVWHRAGANELCPLCRGEKSWLKLTTGHPLEVIHGQGGSSVLSRTPAVYSVERNQLPQRAFKKEVVPPTFCAKRDAGLDAWVPDVDCRLQLRFEMARDCLPTPKIFLIASSKSLTFLHLSFIPSSLCDLITITAITHCQVPQHLISLDLAR